MKWVASKVKNFSDNYYFQAIQCVTPSRRYTIGSAGSSFQQNFVKIIFFCYSHQYKYTPILQERYSTLLEAPVMTMPRYRYTITSIFINVIFYILILSSHQGLLFAFTFISIIFSCSGHCTYSIQLHCRVARYR